MSVHESVLNEGNISGSLVDSFSRIINYLRLSVTDRCNLRCVYCMPQEGIKWIHHNEVLRYEEILRICRVLANMGISVIRITGGEPLVRRGIADLVRELKAIKGIKKVTMTSNGTLLGEHLASLAEAGLDAVNISINTMDEKQFKLITKTQSLINYTAIVDRALTLGLELKVNCVPLAGFNEDDIVKLCGLAKNRKIAIRFIKLMPLGAASVFQPLPTCKVISLIEKEYGHLTLAAFKLGSGPAAYYTLKGFIGYIGIIDAMDNCFCNSCNRLRLNASGILKPCLSSDLGFDLKPLVRGFVSDSEIETAIRALIAKKPKAHSFGKANKTPEHVKKEMFRIGG